MGASTAIVRAGARGHAGTLGPMINPRIDMLLDHVDSNYASVLVAAKRARQINSYYHNLGEGTFDEFPPPMVESRVEELPDHRARGSRRGQDQVPVPVGQARQARRGAHPPRRQRRDRRVQGARGRPPGDEGRATRSASSRRRAPSASSARASFAALTGAPVLVQELERDPLRGAFPGQAAPEHDPASHLELVRNADAFLVAPASANTLAKLAHGLADNLADERRARRDVPGHRGPGHEPRDVGAPGHAREPRHAARARRGGRRARRRRAGHEARVGRRPPGRARRPAGRRRGGRARRRAALGRAARARHRRRHARADRQRALRRQPLARGGWASPWPTRPRRWAPTSPWWPRTSRSRATRACATSTSAPPPSCRRPPRPRSTRADVLLMAAAVADFRPPAAAPAEAQEGRSRRRCAWTSSPPPTCWRRWPRAGAGPDARRLRGRARDGRAGRGARASSSARASTRSCSTTSRAKDIGFEGVHNEVTIVTEDGERRVPRAAKGEVARAILAAVTELRAGAAGEART